MKQVQNSSRVSLVYSRPSKTSLKIKLDSYEGEWGSQMKADRAQWPRQPSACTDTPTKLQLGPTLSEMKELGAYYQSKSHGWFVLRLKSVSKHISGNGSLCPCPSVQPLCCWGLRLGFPHLSQGNAVVPVPPKLPLSTRVGRPERFLEATSTTERAEPNL